MALISKKKQVFPIRRGLRAYLKHYERAVPLPLTYDSLQRYDNAFPLSDSKGQDSLWETVTFSQSDMKDIFHALKKIYAYVKAHGQLEVMEHLFIDRVDLCTYGNTQPFRIRIVNRINDNFDYFYIKRADASRVYGLELEHLLSPNKMNYLVHENTLLEEHVVGIPGDQFIKNYLQSDQLNEIRLAKEFVKFNERCFIRLLGDMHASNFVVDITPDFEDVEYRLRAIDFDQQSYEGRRAVYMPKYFKQNNPIIQLGMRNITPATARQYEREERALIANRVKVENDRIKDLLAVMKEDTLAPADNVRQLAEDLEKFYQERSFLACATMGALVEKSLEMLILKPNLYREY